MVAYNNYHVTGCHFVSKFREQIMPKETFYNLPEDKKNGFSTPQRRKLYACRPARCPSTKSYRKRIFPGEAFYQYFDDKHDLIQYMLSDYINILKDGIRDSLRICKGDIFAAVSRVLDGVIALGRDERNQKGMKNIIGEADKNECTLDFILNLQDEIVKILVEGTDRTLLKNETDDELILLARLLFLLLKNAAAECLHDIRYADRVRAEFLGQQELIKRGTERGGIDV